MVRNQTPSAREREVLLNDFPGIPLLELSASGVILEVNDEYCALVGRSRLELLGHSPLDFTHPEDVAVGGKALLDLRSIPIGGRQIEQRYLCPDGREVWVRVTGARLPQRDGVLQHVVDISDLVAARDQAVAAERRLRALIEHSADIIALLDDQARMVDANPAGQRLLGWKVEDRGGSDLVELIHPDDLPTFAKAMVEICAQKGMHPPVTFRMATPEGTWVYLDTIANNQLDDPAIAAVVVNAHDISHTVQRLQMIETNLEQLVASLARASEYRDPYTAGHQRKVARLSRAIAEHLQLDEEQTKGIELGAHLHDIGKIAVPSEILAKPGKLSPAEYELVKAHPQVGYEILSGIESPWPIADIARHHHERLDGNGYPSGLAGDAINLEVHIVAVADVIDAISSHRPYRPGLGIETAREEIRTNAGRLYDPDVVDAALAVTAPERRNSS